MDLPLNCAFASQSQQSGCSQSITFFGSHARLLLMVSQFTLELQGQIQAIYILRKVYYGSTSPVSPTFGALTCAQHKKSSHTRGTMMTLKFTLRKHLVFA